MRWIRKHMHVCYMYRDIFWKFHQISFINTFKYYFKNYIETNEQIIYFQSTMSQQLKFKELNICGFVVCKKSLKTSQITT